MAFYADILLVTGSISVSAYRCHRKAHLIDSDMLRDAVKCMRRGGVLARARPKQMTLTGVSRIAANEMK